MHPKVSSKTRFSKGVLQRSKKLSDIFIEQYTCPITKELIVDPVIAEDGFMYERLAIEGWFKSRNTSPVKQDLEINPDVVNKN